MEFMTDNLSEAQEMCRQMQSVEGVAEVVIVDQPGWIQFKN
jgi:hypothetical protein